MIIDPSITPFKTPVPAATAGHAYTAEEQVSLCVWLKRARPSVLKVPVLKGVLKGYSRGTQGVLERPTPAYTAEESAFAQGGLQGCSGDKALPDCTGRLRPPVSCPCRAGRAALLVAPHKAPRGCPRAACVHPPYRARLRRQMRRDAAQRLSARARMHATKRRGLGRVCRGYQGAVLYFVAKHLASSVVTGDQPLVRR